MTVAKRELGRTGLQVTTLGYGAMELRGAPRARDISEEQAETILNKVLDSGINYIDTSIDYGLSDGIFGDGCAGLKSPNDRPASLTKVLGRYCRFEFLTALLQRRK